MSSTGLATATIFQHVQIVKDHTRQKIAQEKFLKEDEVYITQKSMRIPTAPGADANPTH
jgi:hypothetical protein